MNKLNIYCKNINQYVPVTGGESLLDIYRRMDPKPHECPMLALVNNKSEDMSFSIYRPKQVEFIGTEHPSVQRAYIRSLCMVMYKAVNDRYPGKRLRFMHSVSNGYYCVLKHEEAPITEEMLDRIKSKMEEIIEHDIPFVGYERLTKDVVEMFRQQGLNDKVRLLSDVHQLYTKYYQLGDIIDSFYGPLVPSTGYLKTFDLRLYEEGMLLLGPDWNDSEKPAQPTSQPKMFKAFTEYIQFNDIIGVDGVGFLNSVIKNGHHASLLINVAEALHNKKFAEIAHDIAQRYQQGGARVVLIAGPSSSGKTTSSKRLAIQLATNYIRPKVIELDNYFVPRERTPLDEDGKYDFEALEAMDLELLGQHLNTLLSGGQVELPRYDFKQGRPFFEGNFMELEENDILIMEGIHALDPAMVPSVDQSRIFRVYASALTSLNVDENNNISTTDNRLLRRMVRDYRYRGTSPESTILRWPSVRRGENKYIFPFQENADAQFNSALLYELPLLKYYAEPLLRRIHPSSPAYTEAIRLLKFLDYIVALTPEEIAAVPPTSILREFIGGQTL